MQYHEAHGVSLKEQAQNKRAERVHHIRIYGHPQGTPESPRWLLEHHMSEHDENPLQHDFDNGHDLLRHVAEHASVPELSDDEGENVNG